MKNRNAIPSDEQSYNTLDNNDTIVMNKTPNYKIYIK
jgi:hypothetical protein